MPNHQLCTAVHHNAAILEIIQTFHHVFLVEESEEISSRHILAHRRNRGDMIVTYKLLSGLYDEQVTLQLDMATIGQHHTRGDSRKLTVMRCRFDVRKYCFTNRIVNMWNSIPDSLEHMCCFYL